MSGPPQFPMKSKRQFMRRRSLLLLLFFVSVGGGSGSPPSSFILDDCVVEITGEDKQFWIFAQSHTHT